MSERNYLEDGCVVVLKSKKEIKKLYEICVKHKIPITYPELFSDKKDHFLWGINKNGVGLVGTIVARNTPKDHVIYSLDELEKILDKN